MKKFIVFFLLCLCLLVSSLFKQEFDFSKYSNLRVQVFTNSKCDTRFNGATYVDNGNGQIIICDYETYKKVCEKQNNISGITYIFDGNIEVFDKVIRDLNVLFTEKTDNSFVGFTNYFSCCVKSDNKKVNVQGYFSNGKIYIGSPLILGSY